MMKTIKAEIRILVLGGLGVLLIWVVYGYMDLHLDREQWGQAGDKFGALNTLFTGLAFVGLVAAFWHERTQASDRDAEQARLFRVMRAQALATHQQTVFEAKRLRLERVSNALAHINRIGVMSHPNQRKELEAEQHKLHGEMDRFSDSTPDWLKDLEQSKSDS